MLHYYEPTILEEWVEKFFILHHIRTPSDLTIENLSAVLGIGVTFAPEVTDEVMFDDDYIHIFINSLYSPKRRWEVFCHELCHPLRHMGNQIMLSNEFRELQEMEANAFQFYAAIPFFMVRKIGLPEDEYESIELLAREFGVTHRFAKQRLEQIQRRVLRGLLQHGGAKALSCSCGDTKKRTKGRGIL